MASLARARPGSDPGAARGLRGDATGAQSALDFAKRVTGFSVVFYVKIDLPRGSCVDQLTGVPVDDDGRIARQRVKYIAGSDVLLRVVEEHPAEFMFL